MNIRRNLQIWKKVRVNGSPQSPTAGALWEKLKAQLIYSQIDSNQVPQAASERVIQASCSAGSDSE